MQELPGGREPFPFEFLPAGGIESRQISIDYAGLSCLFSSHDPDLPHRVMAADRIFSGAHYAMGEHLRLHRIVTRTLAEKVDPRQPIHIEDVAALVGHDLFNQLRDIATVLRDKLPADQAQLLEAAKQLRAVASKHFPTRQF